MRWLLIAVLCISCPAPGKTLTMSLVDYPPRSMPGEPVNGTTPMLINALFKGSPYRIRFQFLPWVRTFWDLEKGNTDLLLYVPEYTTPEFRKKIDGGRPVFYSVVALFFNKTTHPEVEGVDSLTGLKGLHVGTMIKAPSAKEFRKHGLKVTELTTQKQLFDMLLAKRLDLVEAEDVSGIHLIRRLPEAKQRLIGKIRKDFFVMGVHLAIARHRRNHEDIRKLIDGNMTKMLRSGDYAEIAKKNYELYGMPQDTIPYKDYGVTPARRSPAQTKAGR